MDRTGTDALIADPGNATGVDDTAYLATLIQAGADTGVTVRIPPVINGAWRIKELVLPSNCRVDAHGATFKLAGGAPKRMLINKSLTLATPGSVRDSNIEWRGGTFDRETFDGHGSVDGMQTMFGYVDGLRLYDVTTVQHNGSSNTGLYGCWLVDVHTFEVRNFTADAVAINAGSVQMFGGCKDGVIDGVYGHFGDDAVAIVPRDNAAFEAALPNHQLGGCDNILIRNVFCTAESNGVKVLGAQSDTSTLYRTRNIRIENVDGDFGHRGPNTAAMWIGGDSNYTPLSAGIIEDLKVDNVLQRRTSNNNQGAAVQAITVRAGVNIRGLVLRNVRNSASAEVVRCQVSVPVDDLTVIDTTWEPTSSGGYYLTLASGSSVQHLRFVNFRGVLPTTAGQNNGPCRLDSGSTVSTLEFSSCAYTGTVWSMGEIGTAVTVLGRGVTGDSSQHRGWFRVMNNAAIVVREASCYAAANEDFTIDAGASVKSIHSCDTGFRCDVTKLTKAAGDAAFNTNAGFTLGVGPMASNGTLWKHLYSGSTA